jgi:RNA polymerase sigma-70 factor, ECF subfamily
MVDHPEQHAAVGGNPSPEALTAVFLDCRPRLRQAVRLRLDRRLAGRVDPSDVLQEAFLDAMARAHEYRHDPSVPIYLWLRAITMQRLLVIHRRHLNAKMRDARREVALRRADAPTATTNVLAGQLLAKLISPSSDAVRREREEQLKTALDQLTVAEQEILALRHFEDLSNDEIAVVLGVKKSAASARYVRALRRLREILMTIPGFFD